jgi:hypothetical protein
MKKILAAVVIAGCASLFLAAWPADARLASNGLGINKPSARLASNGLGINKPSARLAVNGVQTQSGVKEAGLNFSRIGQKALGK